MKDTTTKASANAAAVFRTLIPARLDRLPWTRFHTLILVALGASWLINGLEVQLASQGGVVLQNDATFGLSTTEVGLLPTAYLIGEVVGALIFARLTDTLGRRKLFLVTLAVFIVGNLASAAAPNLWTLLVFRFIAGLGIGGEQVAIVSAIDELIPAKYRARANIAIGATIWIGVMAGAGAGYLFYNPDLLPITLGWRLALVIGPVLCVPVMLARRSIPESPRWLLTHGQGDEAERITAAIEDRLARQGRPLEALPSRSKAIVVDANPERIGYGRILRVMFAKYLPRSVAAFAVMITQGFLYNAIFFTFALVLANFYHVQPAALSSYIFIFGAGNALGAVLGPLFDSVGRRKMMLVSYVGSGLMLAITGLLFYAGAVNAVTLTLLWWLTFFIASAGAGAAYVVASEVFPVEMRAGALSLFYVASQGVGSIAPVIFGALIGAGTVRGPLLIGYLVAAALIAAGGIIMWFLGVEAAGRSLEEVAPPLCARPDDTAPETM